VKGVKLREYVASFRLQSPPTAGVCDRGPPHRKDTNKITRDIRAALRDLAEGNADRVQSWLDSAAENDPAEALRLWLSLLRYVTPTLQAAAIADVTSYSNASSALRKPPSWYHRG